jgi:hypothetical protein
MTDQIFANVQTEEDLYDSEDDVTDLAEPINRRYLKKTKRLTCRRNFGKYSFMASKRKGKMPINKNATAMGMGFKSSLIQHPANETVNIDQLIGALIAR